MSSDARLLLRRQLALLLEARHLCSSYLLPASGDNVDAARGRDVLYLDAALSSTFRTLLEGALSECSAAADSLAGSAGAHDIKAAAHLSDVLALATENHCLLNADNAQAAACLVELQAVAAALHTAETSTDFQEGRWALLRLHAVATRLQSTVTAESAALLARLAPPCEALEQALEIPANRGQAALEDTVRGLPAAPAAQVAALVEASVQKALELPPWRVITPMPSGGVHGVLRREPTLAGIQGAVFDEPTVLVVDQLGGDEDVPRGCTALLCRQSIDVLCHSALRAREAGAFVAQSSDPADLGAIVAEWEGKHVAVTLSAGRVACRAADARAAGSESAAAADGRPGAGLSLAAVDLSDTRWILPADDFQKDKVGTKCSGVAALAASLPACIGALPGVALPYAALPRALQLPENSAALASTQQAAPPDASTRGHPAAVEVESLHLPDDLRTALAAAAAGLIAAPQLPLGDPKLDQLEAAVKKVWASKWGARAVRAAAALDTPLDTLHMSVLLQPLVNAVAAFVSHTRDPRTAAPVRGQTRMYIEAVTGLGESLVGNVAGRALCFTVDMDSVLAAAPKAGAPPLACLSMSAAAAPAAATVVQPMQEWVSTWPAPALGAALAAVDVEAAPSKAWAVHPAADGSAYAGGLIARSASNMEDLAGYAGAGVFDSVVSRGTTYAPAGAGTFQGNFRHVGVTMLAIALAAAEVGARREGDLDIEGVLDAAGGITIVQARPQN